MSRTPRIRVLLAALALSISTCSAFAAAPAAVPGELIVRFRPGANAVQRSSALARVPASTRVRDFDFIDAALVRFSGMSTESAITELRKDPGVLYAEPNYEIHIDRVPNDPRFPELYAMRNLGQTGGTPGADIRATLAWDLFTGDPNLKVGVIDTGIDYTHPDLAANIWTNPGEIPGNGIDDDHNGYIDDIHGWDAVHHDGDPMDDHGHGTHTSGTIAGAGDNAVGVVGVNWHLKLVAIKFLDASGSGSTAGAIEAVQYAIAAGVRLTSNSWGGGAFSAALLDAINAAGAAGQLFIAAAGNASTNTDIVPVYPADYDTPYVVSVGATDHNDHLAFFSNYGVNSVDLAAPGVDILSTFLGGGYTLLSGTSMACPHAAGVFALAAGRFPLATNLQLRELVLSKCDSIPSLVGLIHGARRLNAYQAILLPDSLPPAPVSDLAVETVGSTAIDLTWTASGDDDTTGTAAGYDLRWSLAPIDTGNFALATPAPTGPPQHSGLTEHVEVQGLSYDTPYYFALRVRDELGNTSPLSNLATGTTLGIPHIQVTPASLTESLLTGDISVQHLTVRNTGEGRLDFSTASPESLAAGLLSRIAVTMDPDPGPGGGPTDPSPGRIGGRGPDRGGYRWRTSDDPAGPTFGWVDIAADGTPIALADGDALSEPIAIGFEFPFYGHRLTSVRVGANGYLTFGGSGTWNANQPLPTAAVPADLLAPWWQDFAAGGPRAVLFQRERERFVVTFTDLPTQGANHTKRTFQVILERTGRIVYQYLALGAATDQGTIGIQDPTHTTGLLVAFDTPFLHDREAVEFLPVGQWLRVSPPSGRVAAGASMPIDVTFDATGLFGGDYSGIVRIDSNDPSQLTTLVTSSLHVTGAPDIAVTPDSLGFGGLFIGASRPDSVRVQNLGTDLLHVTSVSATPAVYTVPGGAFALPPGGSLTLPVTFTPTAAIDYPGTLTIASDDHDEPTTTVRLQGVGLVPPDIAVAPTLVSADLFTGGTAERTFTISNTGGSDLDFSVHAVRAAGSPGQASLAVPVVLPESLAAVVHNHVDPHAAAPTPKAIYSGTFLTFGITELGELMPFQYPPGNEHLAVGTYLDGYTLAYFASGADQIAFSVYAFRQNIVPYSYREIENSASRTIVEVVAHTADGFLAVRRLFTFRKDEKVVDVQTHVENLSGLVVNNVVFKENADWDADGQFPNTWDYDRGRNLVYASLTHYVGFASEQVPDVMDVDGWNDYNRRATTVDFPVGPVPGLDGLETLHFELGTLGPGQGAEVHLAYGAGNTLAELQSLMDQTVAGPTWLSLDPKDGVVPAGGSLTVHARFDAAGLNGGTYAADVHVGSNDPDESDVLVNAQLHVTGAPNIDVARDTVDFGLPFAGVTRMDTVIVRNTGTDVLNLASITTTGAPFFTSEAPGSLVPGASRALVVRYSPTTRGEYHGALVLGSNDPDRGTARVVLVAIARVPPDIAVAPSDISADLLTGDVATQTITITNSDAQELFWTATVGTPSVVATSPVFGASPPSPDKSVRTSPPPPPASELYRQSLVPTAPISPIHAPGFVVSDGTLESTLANLDAGAAVLGAAIPNRYDFSEGVTGNNISDGGNDMYDGGNFLSTEFGLLDYSDGVIVNSGLLGAGGRYFTRKYPGLFVLAADHGGISSFTVSGNLGADGSGNADGSVLQVVSAGVTYRGFVKRVYNAGDPSVNHMVIVADDPIATHSFATNTNDDFHQVTGLQGTRRFYYLLYAGTAGGYIDDTASLEIMKTFLRVLRPNGPWLEVTPSAGVLSPSGHADVTARFRSAGLVTGDYFADVHIESDDPDEPDLITHAHLHVTGAPDIAVEPESLAFATTFVGSARLDTVQVSNIGTDLLSVSSVTSSSVHFQVPGGAFDLAPGASRLLTVTFAPTSAGAHTGTLTINSNDHDRPTATVDLRGDALIPPDIEVTPDSLFADLFTGDTLRTTLTLRNVGGSDLTFEIAAMNDSLSAASAAALEAAVPPAGSAPWGGDSHPLVPLSTTRVPPVARASVAGASTLLLTTTDVTISVQRALVELGVAFDYVFTSRFASVPFTPYQTIIVSMDGGDPGPADVQALANAAAAGKHLILVGGTGYPGYYAGLQSYLLQHTGQQGWTISAPPHVLVTAPADPLASGLPSPNTFTNPSAAFYMLRVADPAAGTVAVNGDGYPLLLHKSIGPGSLVYFLDSPFSPYWSDNRDYQVLRQVIQNALAWSGSGWLSFLPGTGAVPAGASLDVVARFDAARLLGGDYRARIHVRSNDPDEPDVTRPAHLHVTGRPDIAVAPDSLAFGSLFVGASRTDTLHVSNDGTDVLHVTGVVAVAPFHVPSGPFDLAPGASRDLLVTFAPTTDGTFESALVVSSDDVDEPTVTVHLQGEALIAPDIAVSPDSLFADLFTGDTTERVVTVRNTGGSDLQFAITANEVFPTAPAPAAPVPVPPAFRGPTLNTLQPRSGAPVVQATYTGTQLSFGISAAGELMPFQSPLGFEHLAWGTFLSGYTLAYNVAGSERLAYAVYATNFNVVPFSYQELENSATRAVVEVVTHTGDGVLAIRRTFTFVKNRRYVTVASRIENLTAQTVAALVFKEDADWDTDGNFYDTWNYDTNRHLVYASSTHYVGIASAQAPNLMDVYGWNDFDRRVTTVDFPTGPVVSLDGLEVLHFELGTLNPSESRALTFAYGAGNTLDELQSAMDEAVGHPSWLTFAPPDGVVHAGEEVAVHARFDAGGLIGGSYRAAVHVQSNDPDEGDVPLGATLHVTGVPNIAVIPDSLAFGSLFVGATRTDSLRVANTGSDVLHVSAITSSAGEFLPPPAPFDLAVGENRVLAVTFAPTSVGVFTGLLQVTSNAHNLPTATVQLTGEGVAAPDIDADPESLVVSVAAGATHTEPLAILNRGPGTLAWSVLAMQDAAVAPGSWSYSTAGAASAWPGALNRAVVPIAPTVERAGTTPAASPGGTRGRAAIAVEGAGLLAGDPTPGADVPGPDAGPYPASAPVTVAPGGTAAIAPLMVASLETVRAALDVNAGGIAALIPQRFDFTEGDSGAAIVDGGGMYALGNMLYGNTGPVGYTNGTILFHPAFGAGTRYFTRKYPGLFVLAADLNGMSQFAVAGTLPSRGTGTVDGEWMQLDVEGVTYRAFIKQVSGNGGPTVNHMIIVASAPGSSHTFGASPTDDYHQVSGLAPSTRMYYLLYSSTGGFHLDLLVQQQILLAFLATVRVTPPWITVDPVAGTTPPGGASPLNVHFDAAGLLGGTYRGAIQVLSNDPDENPFIVPVSMHVIGVPRLSTSRDTIAFGSVFLGGSRTDSVVVRNIGTDLLSVTGVSAAPGVFSVPTAPFALAPGAQRTLAVGYAPTVEGGSVGALTLVSNDPVTPTAHVVLTGTGLVPPVAGVAPGSLHFSMPEGGRQQATLTLSNSGGSDLVFTVGTSTASVAPTAVAPEALRVSKSLPPTRQDLASRRVAAVAPALLEPEATGNKVLVIADGGTQADVVPVLTAGGYAVTQVADDSFYDGTNPPLTGFNLVVLLDGPGVTSGMPAGGQTAIKNFVAAGGGLLSTEWLAYEVASLNYTILAPVIPLTWGSYADGLFTWNVTTAHPVTAGVSASFNVSTSADIGTVNSGTALVVSGSGAPMVIVSQFGTGRVVHFSCGGNYNGFHPFLVPDMQRLLLNAANWMSGASLLSAAPSAGVVPAHGSLDLIVTADAGLLHGGTFDNSLLISTNDPVHPLLAVPATIVVTAAADIALQPDTLRFAATAAGGSRVDTVQVSNPGSLTLHVSGVAAAAPFSAPAAGFDLAAGATRKIPVTFSPLAPGTFTGSLVVSSDDPDEPTAGVVLKGTGLAAGVREDSAPAALEPPALRLALQGLVPNPPVRDLMVAFTLPDAEPASVELLDLAGRRLRQVEVGTAGPGRHSVSLGAVGGLESGVYLVRLRHGGHSLVSKCVLMR